MRVSFVGYRAVLGPCRLTVAVPVLLGDLLTALDT